jgi:hypothetical protein
MPKIIVFSGHGSWELGTDQYVKLPAKCSIKFYTLNMKTLSDGLGGDLDRGMIAGLEPDQTAEQFGIIPNMRLFPPDGLNIKRPNAANWNILDLPGDVPVDGKNLQVRIGDQFPGGGNLEVLFQILEPAIRAADSVTFLWSACRAINLKNAGGSRIGVNQMQR